MKKRKMLFLILLVISFKIYKLVLFLFFKFKFFNEFEVNSIEVMINDLEFKVL